MENLFESYSPIQIYLPGCQISSQYILATNDLYIVYCSQTSVIILDKITKNIKGIRNLGENSLIKTIGLNKEDKKELAIYNNNEIIIYNIDKDEDIKKIQCENIIYMEFNSNHKLIVLTSKGEIYYHDFLLVKNANEEIPNYTQIKTKNKALCVRSYPFNSKDLVYVNNKNEIYLINIEEKKDISNIKLPVFKGEDYSICTMEWYDIDENYKYLLLGSNTSRIFLVDFTNDNNPIIINQFEKIGNSILSLIWLIFQPGSFITITSKNNKIYFFNVSKNNYKEIKSIGKDSIDQCIKYDKESILFSSEYNDLFIYNIKENNFIFSVRSPHTKRILDLKFNPIKKDIFATCSLDGKVKLWNIKKMYPINSIIIKNISNKNDENENIQVYCIKWSPLNKDLISTGDSLLYLRIYDVNKKKQICNFLCQNKNYTGENNHIQSIDWNMKNKIIVSSQNIIYIFDFEETEKKIKFINSINTDIDIFKIIFNPNKENSLFISCLEGQIKFYDFIMEKPNIQTTNFQGHKYKINDMKFNKLNKILGTSSDDFRIGIWEYLNDTLEKPKYLLGHTDNVTSILWLNNNILLSGSFDNTIKIWNIQNLICLNTIKEHQSYIFSIDNCPLFPSLIFISSNDNTIRSFNYNNLVKLNDLINIDKNINKKIELFGNIEILSKDNLYEKDIDEFFINIKESINSLFYHYLNNKGDLNEEIKNILNEKNKRYLIKDKLMMNDLIRKCLILGEYEKCCELLILLNKWEDALCIAPHVSLDYWKYLNNQYTIFCSKNLNEEKIISGLLSNNSQIVLDELILRKEYEDAKLVWLSRINKKVIEKKPEIIKDDLDKNNFLKEKLFKEIKENKDLYNLIITSSNINLEMGFPIKSCNSYLLIENYFQALKILVQSCQFEMSYLFMKFYNIFIYNNEIITYIYHKRKNGTSKEILKSFINESKCDYHKYCLLKQLKENNIDINSDTKYFQMVKNNDINGLVVCFIEESIKFLNNIFENKIEKNELINIIDLLDIIKYMEIPYNILEKNNLSRLVIIVIILEILNNNYKAAICLIKEFIIIKKIQIEDKLDQKALNYIFNNIKDFEEKKENYFLEEKDKNYIETLIEKNDLNLNFDELRNIINSFNDEKIFKYKCENKQFYYIKNDIFPKYISDKKISTYSNKIIKSKIVSLESGSIISLSEFLEINKYLYIA